MTMIKKIAAIAAATTAFAATPAFAQDASNSDGEARINIVNGMTLTHVADLDFGTVILVGDALNPTAWSETVSLDDADGRDCGTSGFITCAGTTASSAAYTLSATENVDVTVVVPDTVAITNGAGDSITVDLEPELGDLAAATFDGTDTFDFTMPAAASGTQASYDFAFGGSILIDQDTVDGAYSGTITVEASYQ